MRIRFVPFFALATCIAIPFAVVAQSASVVQTRFGQLSGTLSSDGVIRMYRGIPFAAPPVGELRWRAPRPPAVWSSVLKADAFGHGCAQVPAFPDMIFRDTKSEDCLYLNVWTPARASTARLPVMVWIYGGGFTGGTASEPRQDGERLARLGVVLVNFNYRLGVLGFFAHPALTAESKRGASGNYGLLDQIAALQWVHDNIGAFGGDPNNVTIFGESAGSFSVSALMASPLANGMYQKAIGESGAYFSSDPLGPPTLAETEQKGVDFAKRLGATTLAELRAVPADSVLKLAGARVSFIPNVDGYVIRERPESTYAKGRQQHVPLLAGWNAGETRSAGTLARTPPTLVSFASLVKSRIKADADQVVDAYGPRSDADAVEATAAFQSDMFISYSTWKWIDTHLATGRAPVYRYLFSRDIPIAPNATQNGRPVTAHDIGARHAGEIEYVFGALSSVPNVTFEQSDEALSELMMRYWTNFAKTGDPNGAGLPVWPQYSATSGRMVMNLDVSSKSGPERLRNHYLALDNSFAPKR